MTILGRTLIVLVVFLEVVEQSGMDLGRKIVRQREGLVKPLMLNAIPLTLDDYEFNTCLDNTTVIKHMKLVKRVCQAFQC
jgi:hypothetical protein